MRGASSSDSIKKNLIKLIKNENGSVLPIVALSLPVILGLVGLGTDASLWMASKRSIQFSADAAVIAAGWELAQGTTDNMDAAAVREAQRNGYNPTADGRLEIEILAQDEEGARIAVTVSQSAETFFSKIIFQSDIRVSAYAEALISDVDGQFCILALEDEDDGALTTSGSVSISAPSCGIAVNSSDDEALQLSGNVEVEVSNVRVSGDYDINGCSADFTYDSLKTGQSPLSDPYDDLEVPEFEGCDFNNKKVTSSTTLSPGVYCGGIKISGNNDVTFEPGLYIINGGDFKVTGSGSMFGEGVTFILTGSGNDYSQLDISGGKDIEFSAPETGEEWSGITFFQDRDAPEGNNLQNKLTGTSDLTFNGVAYFPSQGLWFGGDSSSTGGQAPCTKLIARTVTFSGNPSLGNNCANYDVEDIGPPTVKLLR